MTSEPSLKTGLASAGRAILESVLASAKGREAALDLFSAKLHTLANGTIDEAQALENLRPFVEHIFQLNPRAARCVARIILEPKTEEASCPQTKD